MVAEIARLGYLNGHVVDVTYGRGVFWKRFRPEKLTTHDLKLDGVDFRNLPHPDGAFDASVIDGPYKCVSLDTEILTRNGWATWATVAVGDEVYTLNHDTGRGEWKPVRRVILEPVVRRRMVAIDGKSHSSLTTDDHRWPVVSQTGARSWATSSTFGPGHRVPLCAVSADQPEVPTIPDAMVELVAWFWTEGHVKGGVGGAVDSKRFAYGHICQSLAINPLNCKRIERAFEELYGP